MLELAGIHDILSKSLGTQNPINLVKATVAGLRGLRTPAEVSELRGLSIAKVLGLTEKPTNGAAETVEGAPGAEDAPPAARAAPTPRRQPTSTARQPRRPHPQRRRLHR